MKARWTAVIAVVWIAVSASARTQIPVTFEAAVTSDGRLELRATAHNEFANRGTVEVQQGDDIQHIPIGLIEGAAIPLWARLDPAEEEVVVRFINEEGHGMAVDVIHIGADPTGGRRVVAPAEREQERIAQGRNIALRDAETQARRFVDAAIKRGKRPQPITDGDPDDPWVGAWNKAVAERQPRGRHRVTANIDECAPYLLSPYNYVYPLRGNVGYIDQLYSYDRWFRLFNPGYSVGITVQQEFENQCGGYVIRNATYSATTGSNGSFSWSSITTIQPPGSNPVTQFRTTTSFVGLVNGASLTPHTHTLPGSQTGFYWSTAGDAVIEPWFSSYNSPYPFFFRWEEEIRYHKRTWSSYGFSSYFTPFRAAYAPGGQVYGAYFYPVSPGMAVFDELGDWIYGFVMAHELGHHFQFRLQGDRLTSTGPVHSVCTILLEKDAFIEGFADWYGVFWNDEGSPGYGPICGSGECYASCSAGYRKEGNVMQYFWDIFDATNHATRDQGKDTIFRPLSILKNWRATGDYSNFPDWYNDFLGKGIWSGYETVVNDLRAVNGVQQP